MAPLPAALLRPLSRSAPSRALPNISGLAVSSLELDSSATAEDAVANLLHRTQSSPLLKSSHLVPRADSSTNTYVPCAGCKSPESFNNQVYFALFAILGVAMVLASLWFFFWSKHGGFKWQEGDWEDYKSTVLRRKGPDGRTISGTRSTKYSGQSIAEKQARWAAKSVIARDEKGRKGILAQRGFGGTHSAYYRDNFTDFGDDRTEAMSEVTSQAPRHHKPRAQTSGHHSQRYRDRDLKQYRHERVARVGGINREADGSHFDSETMTETSSDTYRPKKKKTQRSEEIASAERKARHDAAAMERQWKRDADRAAAEAAREPPIELKPTPKSRTPSPTKKPAGARRESRASSPQKRDRDFSYAKGDDSASAGHTNTSAGQNSYYDAYRPHATSGRQSSPVKAGRGGGGRDVMAGYRRGMSDI
ncbi:hypothetical protein MBLNU457_5148t2 [Dothideomycetes sp. NU457]